MKPWGTRKSKNIGYTRCLSPRAQNKFVSCYAHYSVWETRKPKPKLIKPTRVAGGGLQCLTGVPHSGKSGQGPIRCLHGLISAQPTVGDTTTHSLDSLIMIQILNIFVVWFGFSDQIPLLSLYGLISKPSRVCLIFSEARDQTEKLTGPLKKKKR